MNSRLWTGTKRADKTEYKIECIIQDVVQIDVKGGIKRLGKYHEERYSTTESDFREITIKSARRNNQAFTKYTRIPEIYSNPHIL